MRTLAIFHSGDISGPLRTLLPRLRALGEEGEVQLLFPWEGAGSLLVADFPVGIGRYGPTVLPRSPAGVAALPLRAVRELAALGRAIRAARPDVVIVATAYLPLALVAARLQGVPTVLYAAELLGSGVRRGPAPTVGAAAFRRVAEHATAIVACSDRVAGQFSGKPQLEVMPPGVFLRDGRPADLPGTSPRIAVVGALSRGRGQDVAVDALALLRAEVPEATLLVVGEPHPRPQDATFAAELRTRAGDGVHFLGAVREIEPLLAASDVVVVPNRVDEGFGRVAFEAMAASTPVVTTPFGGAARLLEDGVDLLVVPPERPDLLANAVLKLVRDPVLAGELSGNGRSWVGENLDEAELSRRFVDVVLAVAHG